MNVFVLDAVILLLAGQCERGIAPSGLVWEMVEESGATGGELVSHIKSMISRGLLDDADVFPVPTQKGLDLMKKRSPDAWLAREAAEAARALKADVDAVMGKMT